MSHVLMLVFVSELHSNRQLAILKLPNKWLQMCYWTKSLFFVCKRILVSSTHVLKKKKQCNCLLRVLYSEALATHKYY